MLSDYFPVRIHLVADGFNALVSCCRVLEFAQSVSGALFSLLNELNDLCCVSLCAKK